MLKKRLRSVDEPFLVVRSVRADVQSGTVLQDHRHDWHQLIFGSAGVLTVWTQEGSWVAPPSWAICVPAGTSHNIRFVGPCAFRTLYLRPDYFADMPRRCMALAVSALLRELILRIGELRAIDRRNRIEAAMALLLAAEFRDAGRPSFCLPMPTGDFTRRVADSSALHSSNNRSTSSLARQLGIGARTLERRFVAETGMTLGRWRQQQRLFGALEQLATGKTIKIVAAAAGYQTPSAFVAAFRKLFGTTPARYFSHTIERTREAQMDIGSKKQRIDARAHRGHDGRIVR